ncbi:MAG: hotdog family protein [Zoogloeaceae bacterium]|nr:hotdog family protein [Zoogloeaceae bacterium]
MLDRSWIAAHIPHQGAMCLLDEVMEWSDAAILCRTMSHLNADHPLREGDRLGAAHGIEYAAQAMAIHGALLADCDGPPRQGYLTSVRGVRLHVPRLDDGPGALWVRAERLTGDANHVMYSFSVEQAGRCLVEGRASVVLDASALRGATP